MKNASTYLFKSTSFKNLNLRKYYRKSMFVQNEKSGNYAMNKKNDKHQLVRKSLILVPPFG